MPKVFKIRDPEGADLKHGALYRGEAILIGRANYKLRSLMFFLALQG